MGKWSILRNSTYRGTLKSILLIKKCRGLVEMTFGLINASFSLPELQAVKMTFFAPWIWGNAIFKLIWIYPEVGISFTMSNCIVLHFMHNEGDMEICGVAIFFFCVVLLWIRSHFVVLRWSQIVWCVMFFYFKAAVFGEKKLLADPLQCCGLLWFDTFDWLALAE